MKLERCDFLETKDSIRDTILTAKEFINRIIRRIDILYEEIQAGSDQIIGPQFNELVDALDWLMKAIGLTSQAHKQNIDIQEINPILLNIENSYAIKDSLLIGDILLYELKPLLNSWRERL